MPWSTLSVWSFGNPVSHPCQTFSMSWWCGAWSHREADTRPEAGLFSPKPGVTPLVDDNLSVRGLGHSE